MPEKPGRVAHDGNSGGIEVLIVNDASTDDSLKQAMEVQRNSRHPVRIIDKRLNTGLADARNLGLQLARAPYAFILDADNMVFPRALEQLHATIVREQSSGVAHPKRFVGSKALTASGWTAFLFRSGPTRRQSGFPDTTMANVRYRSSS